MSQNKSGIRDNAMLDDFEQSRAIFALRQRVEHSRIDQYRQRLMETPDQVLARSPDSRRSYRR